MTNNKEPKSPKKSYDMKGGCYCGATSYEIIGKPLLSAYCHCTLCQRLSGAPFINTIHIPYESFKWTYTSSLEPSQSIQSPPTQSQSELTTSTLTPTPTLSSQAPSIPGLQTYSVQDKLWKTRYRCLKCGVCVASYHGKNIRWSVWGSHLKRNSNGEVSELEDGSHGGDHGDVLMNEEFKPRLHMFYGTRLLDVNDGLPKWSGYENVSERLG